MTRTVQTLLLVLLAGAVAVLVGLSFRTKQPPPFHPRHTPRTPTAGSAAAKPASLWIGDSYTAGVGAPSEARSEACLTATAMGWTCRTDGQPGTGFVADGHTINRSYRPLIQRLPHDKSKYQPNVVIMDAGRNDRGFPLADVESAAHRELAAVRRAWPRARLVVIAPYYMNGVAEPLGAGFVSFLKTQAAKYHGRVIDPVTEGWINARSAARTTADQIHPDAAGHRYLARHLSADFKRIGLAHLPRG